MSRTQVRLTAALLALFEVVGSYGATRGQPLARPMDVLGVLLVVAGPAALAVRDRWPVLPVAVALAATDMYLALGYAYGPIFVGVAVALFTAVLAGRRRETWVLAALGYAGFVGAALYDPRQEVDLLHYAVAAGWGIGILAVADVVRSRREQAAEQRHRRAGEQRLLLAQELHDVLAHNISLVNVQASVALHLLDEKPEQARPALEAIKAASSEALHELRTALDVLRRGEAAPRSPAPRLVDLDALVDVVRAGGLDVRIETYGIPVALPAAVELAAYRIVQEALTNVVRHARARHATVVITYGEALTVAVADDGMGGGAVAGNGINGMRERAASIGGAVDAGPRPEGGFSVVATLPVRQP